MLLPGLPAAGAFDVATVSARTWALGAFIVVFPTALAYHLSYWALARVDSSLVAFFIYLQPLIATSLSVALFGESLTAWMLAGAALILLAGYLVLRPRPVSRAAARPDRGPGAPAARLRAGGPTRRCRTPGSDAEP
jgi:drug/metabolite transporter (DMT)-like permease